MYRRLILDFEESPSFETAQRLIIHLLRIQRPMDVAKDEYLTHFLTCDQEIFILREILYGMRRDPYGMAIDKIDWERDSDANFLVGDSDKVLLHMIEQIPFYRNLDFIGQADFINNNKFHELTAEDRASWDLRKTNYEKECQKKLDKVLEEYFKKVLYDKRRGDSYKDAVSDKSMITLYSLGSIDFLKELIKKNDLDFFQPDLADIGRFIHNEVPYFRTFRDEDSGTYYFFSDLRDSIVDAYKKGASFSPEEFAWSVLNNDTFVQYRTLYDFHDAEHILDKSSYEGRVEYLRGVQDALDINEDNDDFDSF